MKRIFLFILTNILVVLTISVIVQILGVGRYLTAQGIDYGSLATLCLIWGMTGSLISLAISRMMAKFSMGVRVIDRSSSEAAWLVQMIDELSRKAGLPVCPEVGIYESPEVNAFATGPSKRRALVAFSTGLLNSMNRNEVEGVAAHEIAHIANGDMVTMTLLQGVINAFVMFLARVIGFAIAQGSRDNEGRQNSSYLVVMVLEMALGLLGMMVVCAFSRHREYRADRGGAKYAGKADMIAALERLGNNRRQYDDAPAMAAFKISGGPGKLFSTHPPLESRIAALRAAAIS
jgi:heat shock protein HtpX